MRVFSNRCWSYILASALLQIFMFPVAGPLHPWSSALGWIALTPLIAALLLPSRLGKPLTPFESAKVGYLVGVLWYLGSCYWIYQTMNLYGGLAIPVSVAILVLFSCYLGLYHAAFGFAIGLIRRFFPNLATTLAAAPFFWVAGELARGRITGFPWNLLGYSEIDNLLLTRLAPIAGVTAISFTLVAVGTMFVPVLLKRDRNRTVLAVCGLLVASALQFGGSVLSGKARKPAPATESAVLLQEDLRVGVQKQNAPALSPAEELNVFARWSENPLHYQQDKHWHPGTMPEQASVVVWPEAPSHLQSNDPAFRQSIARLAQSTHGPVIAGSLGVDLDPIKPRGYSLYDSASLFSADGIYQSRYDKIHLVPWGEYIPYKQIFSFASKLTEGVGDMDRGTRRTVFRADGRTFGVFICYESIFGNEVRQFSDNGAEVLVNISDDGWYGDTSAPWQHLNMARMRAIENHRWLLRSTNTGITAAIDPYGRVVLSAPRDVRAAFVFPFDFLSGKTFYTQHGDWFAWLSVAVSATILGMGWLRHRALADNRLN